MFATRHIHKRELSQDSTWRLLEKMAFHRNRREGDSNLRRVENKETCSRLYSPLLVIIRCYIFTYYIFTLN